MSQDCKAKGRPDVSVVIPTYNRLTFLKQAISSCLEGNEGIDLEVIIIDDGSTDGTLEYLSLLEDARIRYFSQNHQGAQAARNHGLAEASGHHVKFLDDDDWLASGVLSIELAHLREKKADICSGDLILVNELGIHLYKLPGPLGADIAPELLASAVQSNPLRFTLETQLARKIIWNQRLDRKQDTDYFLRISLIAERHITIPCIVGYVRCHGKPRVSNQGVDPSPVQQLSVLSNVISDYFSAKPPQSPKRIAGARDGLWQMARMCAVLDFRAAWRGWRLLESLSADSYLPARKSQLLKISDAMIGSQWTEVFLVLPRWIKWRLFKWLKIVDASIYQKPNDV